MITRFLLPLVFAVAIVFTASAAPVPVTYAVELIGTNTSPTFVVSNGSVTTAIGTGHDNGRSVSVQPDGKILVAGDSQGFALVRYNSDGSLDESFSSDGIVTTGIGLYAFGRSVSIQPDSKILVAGYTFNNGYVSVLVRYNPDGSLDSSFSDDGIVTTSIGFMGHSLTLQPDGKILVAGYNSNNDFILLRYNTDGSLDISFSNDGIVTTDIGPQERIVDEGNSVALQPDGKILVAGPNFNGSDSDFALVRYNSDGSLDSSFSDDGIVTTDIGLYSGDAARSVTVQADGKILVAGKSYNGSRDFFALVRYNSDGSLDSSFSDDGIVTSKIGEYSFSGYSVAVQSDGKILVAGDGSIYINDNDFALARYNSDGTLDSSFSDDGIVTTTISNVNSAEGDHARSMALQLDGKILVAGRSYNGSNFDFALVRYNSDGTLDNTFSPPRKYSEWYPSLHRRQSLCNP